jgi:hypothetical protein
MKPTKVNNLNVTVGFKLWPIVTLVYRLSVQNLVIRLKGDLVVGWDGA